VPAAAGQAGELIEGVLTLLRLGPALLLALHLPPALAAEAAAPAANARSAAFAALNRCSSTRQQEACVDARSALEALIRQEEAPEQRLKHPRCLGALTHVETVLAAFRWRLENAGNLQRVIEAAVGQCPASTASAAVGQ
jgi:hypothetical protein